MTDVVNGRFRFLLGEVHLGTWRPRLLVREQGRQNQSGAWPDPADLPQGELPAGIDGVLFRQASVDRFAVGIERFGKWLSYVPRHERSYYVDLGGTHEEYLSRRSAKSRYNLKRSLKMLREANSQPILEVFTSCDAMAVFHREAIDISRETYQARLLQVGLPDTETFLAAMQKLAREGAARGYLLKDQGIPIAFAWCTARGNRISYDVIGYRPDRAASSPGTVLLALILEDLFRLQQYESFHFGVGEGSYKAAFSTGRVEYADAYLFAPTILNRILVSAHLRIDQGSARIGAWLEHHGLKTRVRKLIRRLRGTGR